jgi:curved DNA-binding protein CbpA
MEFNYTHYQNLNISENSSDEDIEFAYDYLSQKYSNDFDFVRKISYSYNVLIDPVARTEYDSELKKIETDAGYEFENRKIIYILISTTALIVSSYFTYVKYKDDFSNFINIQLNEKSKESKQENFYAEDKISHKKNIDETQKNIKSGSSEKTNFSQLAISALSTLYNKSDLSGSVKIANDKLATIWFEQDFYLKNDLYHTVFIYENDLDENSEVWGMNGVSVQIDVVTYKKNDVEWSLVTAQKNVASKDDGVGNYGKPSGYGAESIKTLNNDLFFLIEDSRISETDKKMYAYDDTFKQLFIYMNDKWIYAGSINSSASNEDQLSLSTFKYKWKYKGSISLNEKIDNSIPDIIVKKIGTELDNSEENIVFAKDDIYHFNGTRYTKIKPKEKIFLEQDLLTKWNNAHSVSHIQEISDLYDSTVKFYGQTKSNQEVINAKIDFLKKYPNFKQEVSLNNVSNDGDVLKIKFNKDVILESNLTKYTSYLEFHNIAGVWKIIAESDTVTDENLSKNQSKRENIVKEKNECYNLWYQRNLIYAENGYCFTSNLGKEVFKNFHCVITPHKLSNKDKNKVDDIINQEKKLGCDINTDNAQYAPNLVNPSK